MIILSNISRFKMVVIYFQSKPKKLSRSGLTDLYILFEEDDSMHSIRKNQTYAATNPMGIRVINLRPLCITAF